MDRVRIEGQLASSLSEALADQLRAAIRWREESPPGSTERWRAHCDVQTLQLRLVAAIRAEDETKRRDANNL